MNPSWQLIKTVLFNPSVLLALLATVLASAGAAGVAGYKAGANAVNAERMKEERAAHSSYVEGVKRAIGQAAEVARQDAEVSAGQEQTRERIRTVYRTINQEVEKNVAENPDYQRCGLDAAGLCWWNAVNRGDSLDGAGQCDARMPGPAPGAGWKLGHAVPQPQGSGAAVPGMPGDEPGQGGGDQKP